MPDLEKFFLNEDMNAGMNEYLIVSTYMFVIRPRLVLSNL